MLAQKNDGQRRSENGGGVERSGSGRENSGYQRQRDEERNPKLDPRLRVMEIFKYFLYETNRDGITCPKGEDDREVCIKFHSKGN